MAKSPYNCFIFPLNQPQVANQQQKKVWKAMHDNMHPLKIQKLSCDINQSTTTALSQGNLVVTGKTELAQCTFLSDTSNAWSKIPFNLKSCDTIGASKKAIRLFVEQFNFIIHCDSLIIHFLYF